VPISVIASDDDGHLAINTLDGDLDTRWSEKGDGEWIEYDLGTTRNITSVNLAFHKGDERDSTVEIIAFDASRSSETVIWSKDKSQPSRTKSLQNYNTVDISARYVRIVGYGNTSNDWNSITEVGFRAGEGIAPILPPTPVVTPTPTPTPVVTPTPTPTPTPVVTPTPTPTPVVTPTPTEIFVPTETYYSSADDLSDLLATVSAGSEIIVTGSGEISIKNLNFSSEVLVRAETIGGATLTNATITNSNNISLQGFVFGPNDESTLLKIVNSTNIKVLRNLFDHEDVTESQTSLVMTQASDTIEIAYNEFRNKNLDNRNGTKITGSFIKTQLDEAEDGSLLMSKNVHIHHNHFDNIAPFLVNGVPAGDSDREAIAMGIADSQDIVTNNLIEYNLFENCDGENEIVTVKTSNNVFRYNTFKNSMGSLSFRLGSNNEAYGNYFYGEGAGDSVADENFETGGIRIYGAGHTVRDNYMEGLTGTSWRRPILIDSGDTSESTGNDSHETPTNIDIYNNMIIDSVGGGIYIGSDNYKNVPTDITIDGNIVIGNEATLFDNYADKSSNIWSGNKAYATGSAIAVDGGALSASEVEVLNSALPTSVEVLNSILSTSKPSFLTESDVGPSAQ